MLTNLKVIKEYPLLILIYVLLAFMFFIYLFKQDTPFSDMENRYLTSRPAITIDGIKDGTFMRQFETYTEEQVPFRNELIKAKAVFERLTLKCENNGIVAGKDGYLFEKVLNYNAQLLKNEAILETFIKNADRNIYIAIAPNSYEVLKELAPTGFPNIDQGELLNQFYDRLSAYENCTVVDLQEALKNRGEEQVFYKTDHHWTTLGAYYGYEAFCERTGNSPVDLAKLTEKQVPDFYGTYYAKYKGYGVGPDTITYYNIPIQSLTLTAGTKNVLYDMNKTAAYDKYAMFLYGNDGLCEIKSENARNGKNLVVFKDSYANCLIPFLTYNYDTITVVDLRYYGGSVTELLHDKELAEILFLYNFSQINEDRHFYRLTS